MNVNRFITFWLMAVLTVVSIYMVLATLKELTK
jgi:hypothetical protein